MWVLEINATSVAAARVPHPSNEKVRKAFLRAILKANSRTSDDDYDYVGDRKMQQGCKVVWSQLIIELMHLNSY